MFKHSIFNTLRTQMYFLDEVGPESATVLRSLWIETFEQAYFGVHNAENIKAYCRANFSFEQAVAALSDIRVKCTIAKKEEQSVGFSLLYHADCPLALEGGAMELKQIYLLSSHFGTGLGKLLFEDAVSSIQSTGHRWIWLCVSDINYRAQAFYRKNGFEKIGAGPEFQVGTDRLTSSIMARNAKF